MTLKSCISGCLRSLPAAVLIVALAAHAHASPNVPDNTVEDALHHMSDQAGVVFLGEVIAIRHRKSDVSASGIVEIDFRVDQAVRGCDTGSTYTLREWAGLWSGGDQRYRIGQRLLMLLHTPGAAGLTSPVGGMAGAIPIHASSSAPSANDTASAITPPVADLRWVGAQLLRTVPSPNVAPLAVASTISSSSSRSDVSTPAQQAPVNVVVDMLTSWQKDQHVVR